MSNPFAWSFRIGPAASATAILLAVIFPGPTLGQDRAPSPTPAPTRPDPIVERLVESHNRERAAEKLPPLKLEAKLTEAARVHARDMADHEMMAHEGSDDSHPEQRVAKAGYHYLRTGENVAMGYRDVPEVIQGWMESPGHRKNILGDFTEIGVALVAGASGKPYWCVEFGTPMPQFDPINASKDLIQKINEARAAAKLPPLVEDERLAKSAKGQAATQAAKASPGGGQPNYDGIDQKSWDDLAVSTASGHPDAETMVRKFLEKPNLREQLLGKFARVGAGYATAPDGVPYWCLILGNPARRVNSR